MDKIKVFIVDDNIAARSILTNLINSDENFIVVGEAGTGQGGIIMLEETNPDVVILEASVAGGMTIENIVKELKNIAPTTKVVLCANKFENEKLMNDSILGADDIIVKPYKKEVIFRVVRECIVK